jgi:hypothetical protein
MSPDTTPGHYRWQKVGETSEGKRTWKPVKVYGTTAEPPPQFEEFTQEPFPFLGARPLKEVAPHVVKPSVEGEDYEPPWDSALSHRHPDP